MTDISHYTKNLGRVSIIEDEIADTVDSFCMLEEMNIHKKKRISILDPCLLSL